MVRETSPKKSEKLSPEESLKSSKHIKEIIYPDSDSLLYEGEPLEIQFKNILAHSKLTPEIKKQLDDALMGYLKAPAIIDDFDDERDRNALENNVHDLSREGSALYKSNRLRITNIRHVIQLSDLLTVFVDLKEEQKEKLKAGVAEIWAGVADTRDENKRKDNFEAYDRMPVLDKVTFTEKVATLAKTACITLIESQKK